MGTELIRTDVDRLIEILKEKKSMSISKMAKELEVPEENVQSWVDFLVEEKIIAMDYQLTTPVISLMPEYEHKKNSRTEREKLEAKEEEKQTAQREEINLNEITNETSEKKTESILSIDLSENKTFNQEISNDSKNEPTLKFNDYEEEIYNQESDKLFEDNQTFNDYNEDLAQNLQTDIGAPKLEPIHNLEDIKNQIEITSKKIFVHIRKKETEEAIKQYRELKELYQKYPDERTDEKKELRTDLFSFYNKIKKLKD